MCDQNNNIVSGILIGAVGGFVAGISVWIASIIREEWLKRRDKKRVYNWLKENVGEQLPEKKWRSAKTIASYTDLPIDRVIYICSIHKGIAPSTGEADNIFTLKTIAKR